MHKYPDFIIMGAAKSGTTSLYRYLTMHPQIFMCNPKEPEYFARDDIYEKGTDWYLSLFSEASEHQISGEASTIYSLWPHFPKTARRMSELLPDVKLIYIMRNPVDRAYSYYVQLVKNHQNATRINSISRTFEECIFPQNYSDRADRDDFFAPFDAHLPDNPGLFIDGGNYYEQIQKYRDYFPSNQMLLLLFDDFLLDPASVLKKICEFLEIDDSYNFINGHLVAENVAADHFNGVLRTNVAIRLKSNYLIKSLSSVLPKTTRQQILR